MQKKTKIGLAVGVAALAVAGGVAGIAHAQMGGGHGGMGGGHGMIVEMFERYDTNKDGKISQDEINQNRATWIAEFDVDKSGGLSIQEFQALWLKARNTMMVREFQRFDKNGDGQVTLEEYQAPLDSIVADRDRNGDGFLSRDDRPPRHESMRGRHRMKHGMGQGPGPGPGDDAGPAEGGGDGQ